MPILRSEPLGETEIPKAITMPSQFSCSSVCAFSQEEDNAFEVEQRSKSATKLKGLILFYLLVMSVEIVGGLKANSLAVITDAGHLLSDVAGFSIALFSVRASGWKATPHMSFGYHRLEVLGALVSVLLIWLISGMLIVEAVNRIVSNNTKINGILMFMIAAFGFIINFIMVVWLGHHHHTHHGCGHSEHNHDHHVCEPSEHDHDHEMEEVCTITEEQKINLVSNSPQKASTLNINLQGAYLHVMVDMIQSLGVMIAGGIIWVKPDWLVVDLICTLIFSVLSLSTTISMLRNIFGILIERTPSEIDINKLEKDLKCIEGVLEVRDLHVWALTVGKIILSCHVKAEPTASSSSVIVKIRDYCEKKYNIHHVTIQVE